MMHLPASVRVYLCTSACDMRRSFDGLHALVTQSMQLDAFGGHLFVFSYASGEPHWRIRTYLPDTGMDGTWISLLLEPSDAAEVLRAALPGGRRFGREYP